MEGFVSQFGIESKHKHLNVRAKARILESTVTKLARFGFDKWVAPECSDDMLVTFHEKRVWIALSAR